MIDIEDDIPDDINKEIAYDDGAVYNKDNYEANNNENEEENNIIKSDISRKDWLREVDRISSKLKIDYENATSSYSSEWRTHVDQLKNNDKNLAQAIPTSRTILENLSEDIMKSLENISKKESSVTKGLSQIVDKPKPQPVIQEHLDEYNKLRANVDKLQKDIEETDEKIQDIQRKQIETDNPAATHNMKQAIVKLTVSTKY